MKELFVRLMLAALAFFLIYLVTAATSITGGELIACVIPLGIILSKEGWIHESTQKT